MSYTIYICEVCDKQVGPNEGVYKCGQLVRGHFHPNEHSEHTFFHTAVPATVYTAEEAREKLTSDGVVVAVAEEQARHKNSALSPIRAGLHRAVEEAFGEEPDDA